MLPAETDSAVWLTRVRGDSAIFQEAIRAVVSGGRQASDAHYDAMVTYFHEATHFWHSLSTNFLYDNSLNTLRWVMRSLDRFRTTGFSAASLKQIEAEFNDLTEPLYAEDSQLRAIDVIEGAAVYNSYTALEHQPGHADFLKYLDEKHPQQPTYQRAYIYATEKLGGQAFNVFPMICFEALQAFKPGQRFQDIVDNGRFDISLDGQGNLVYKITDADITDHFISYFIARGGRRHRLLEPYLTFLAQLAAEDSGNLAALESFFSGPTPYITTNFSKLPKSLTKNLFMPQGGQETAAFVFINDWNTFLLASPVTVFFLPEQSQTIHGRVVYGADRIRISPAGLATLLEPGYATFVQQMFAMKRMVEAAISQEKISIEMQCVLADCPLNKTKYCSGFYLFPAADFRQCQFPPFLKSIGIDPQKLI